MTPCGLQSDTVEGVIHDREFDWLIDVHFTSAFDPILQRWVPVLALLIFGRTKQHYKATWNTLLDQLGEKANSLWENLQGSFPGVTADWSDGLCSALLETLMDRARKYGHQTATVDEMNSFLKKCDVHFKRGMTKIARNSGVVPPDEESNFRRFVDDLLDPDTTLDHFNKTVQLIIKYWPQTARWLKWHVHKKRAPSYFPACMSLNTSEWKRVEKMSSTTNEQENVSRQFQHDCRISSTKEKLTLDEALRDLWQFCNFFEVKHCACANGQDVLYNHYPASPLKGDKKTQEEQKRRQTR